MKSIICNKIDLTNENSTAVLLSFKLVFTHLDDLLKMATTILISQIFAVFSVIVKFVGMSDKFVNITDA